MGLDMYLYKVKKLGQKKIKELDGMKEKDIYENYDNIGVFHIPEDEENDEEFYEMFRDIIPYCTRICISCDYIDMEQIRKDADISDDWSLGGRIMSPTVYEYRFYSPDGKHKTVTIPVDELEKKYIITEREEVYVVKRKEVGYWRKQYDLQDLLYKDYGREIYNCGYHRVNANMFDDIMAYKEVGYGGLNREIKTDDVLFYHEWY